MILRNAMTLLQPAYWGGLVAVILAFLMQALPVSAEFYFGKVWTLDADRRLMVIETTDGRAKEFTMPTSEPLVDLTEGANIFAEVDQNKVKKIGLLQALPASPPSPISPSETGRERTPRPAEKASTEGSGGLS